MVGGEGRGGMVEQREERDRSRRQSEARGWEGASGTRIEATHWMAGHDEEQWQGGG